MMFALETLALFWVVCSKEVIAFVLPSPSTYSWGRNPLHAAQNDNQCARSPELSLFDSRRRVIITSVAGLLTTTMSARPSFAADPDPLFDLSQQIRKSAVRGAQVIDKIDGKWERFSDDFGLGKKRNMPKVDKLNKTVGSGSAERKQVKFNNELGSILLQECDKMFLKSFKTQQPQSLLSAKDLSSRVENVKSLVRKSFFPSPDSEYTSEDEFNYEIYSHFRAYNDILIEQKVVFSRFYSEFERGTGTRLLELITPLQSLSLSSSTQIKLQLQNAFQAADIIGEFLLENGFISSWERSVPSEDDVEDFIEPYVPDYNFSVTSDLEFTFSLTGDVTLKTQLLLQELGYKFYPSFGSWSLRQVLLACFPNRSSNQNDAVVVNIDDYYMDTSYNSNPDLFEVKQVLLNIVLQRN